MKALNNRYRNNVSSVMLMCLLRMSIQICHVSTTCQGSDVLLQLFCAHEITVMSDLT